MSSRINNEVYTKPSCYRDTSPSKLLDIAIVVGGIALLILGIACLQGSAATIRANLHYLAYTVTLIQPFLAV